MKVSHKNNIMDFKLDNFLIKNALSEFKKFKDPQLKLGEISLTELNLFNRVHKLFNIIKYLIKYAVFCDKKYLNSYISENKIEAEVLNETIHKTTINIPKNLDDLLNFFRTYPKTINILNDELSDILMLDNYEGLFMLNKIPETLFFSVFDEYQNMKNIEYFKKDINNMQLLVEKLLKKIVTINVTNQKRNI